MNFIPTAKEYSISISMNLLLTAINANAVEVA
jgi:hypothetical protein